MFSLPKHILKTFPFELILRTFFCLLSQICRLVFWERFAGISSPITANEEIHFLLQKACMCVCSINWVAKLKVVSSW